MNTKQYRQGVGALILNNNDEIFIAKRVTPKNSWQMPQGGIDDGENPEVALLRELQEEIGTNNIQIIAQTPKLRYYLPKAVQKNLFHGKYVGQEQIWYIVRFLGTDSDINLNYHHTPEFIEWKWASEHEVLEKIITFKYKMYQNIIAYMHNVLKKEELST